MTPGMTTQRQQHDPPLLVGRHRHAPVVRLASAGSRSGSPAAPASSRCSGRGRGCPGCPRTQFDGEVGVADDDDARLRASACRRPRRRPAPARLAPRARAPTRPPQSTTGPCLSPLASSRATSPAREQRLQVGLGPALRAGLDDRLRGAAADAAGHRRDRPRERVRRQQVEPLGDRVRRVARRDRAPTRRCRSSWPDAAHVDDDVVADLDRPSRWASATRLGSGGLSAFSGGSISNRHLPPFAR